MYIHVPVSLSNNQVPKLVKSVSDIKLPSLLLCPSIILSSISFIVLPFFFVCALATLLPHRFHRLRRRLSHLLLLFLPLLLLCHLLLLLLLLPVFDCVHENEEIL